MVNAVFQVIFYDTSIKSINLYWQKHDTFELWYQ